MAEDYPAPRQTIPPPQIAQVVKHIEPIPV